MESKSWTHIHIEHTPTYVHIYSHAYTLIHPHTYTCIHTQERHTHTQIPTHYILHTKNINTTKDKKQMFDTSNKFPGPDFTNCFANL